jgi:hypothetical protein
VKRTTATIVRPPFVAIFKVRAPASRYCDWARSKVTWPWPCGPPDALYMGRMVDPTGALSRVDMDANEGFAATRAKNLAQMVLEYKERTQFAGQAVHAAVPVDALYLPASHAVHGPPFGPVAPALQVQFVKAALPAGELEFDGQALHVEFAEAPTAVEYVPAPQSVHSAAPVKALYLPGMHAAHVHAAHVELAEDTSSPDPAR